jgi:hypothetical protein
LHTTCSTHFLAVPFPVYRDFVEPLLRW